MKVNDVKEMTISDFFDMCKNEEGEFQIDTPDGWKDINFLVKKKNKECYKLTMHDNSELEGSITHKVLTNNGWKKSQNIDMGKDQIFVKDKLEKVIKKKYTGIKDTFDLQVDSEQHRYFSNGIISHNCGKSLVCKAISSAWKMPLLRLDFGKLFGSLVGDSEKNAREAIRQAEAVSPCVTGDTKIFINGQEDSIENFFNSKVLDKNNDVSVFRKEDKEIQKVVYINKGIKAYIRGVKNNNVEDIELEDIELKAITRTIKKEKLLKITTESGISIIATQDHLLMTEKNEMKKIKNVQKDDRISIVCINNIQGYNSCENQKNENMLILPE